MDNQKILADVYYNDICDFSNKQDCERLKEKNRNLSVSAHPLFSFLMCVYNDTSLLNSAINSVLRQSFTDWELIILDNSDKTEQAWEMIQNAMAADPRIKGMRSKENVGWPKGAAICLSQAKGEYTTFLAADDCINIEALQKMSTVLYQEKPDILWVGNAYVQRLENGQMEMEAAAVAQAKVYGKENRSDAIVEIMKTVYYNSFFHYMRVDFLRANGIDFFEPYYADCAGMTKAMAAADKMVVLDEIIYFLTMNTSQTAGKYIWDSYDFMFGNQWRCIKEVFLKEQYDNASGIEFVILRIMRNLLGSVENLCYGHCRNKYMNPMQVQAEEIIGQLEQITACDAIAEMLQRGNGTWFKEWLKVAAVLKTHGIDGDSAVVVESTIKPLLQLALKQDVLTKEEKVVLMLGWLVQDNNPRMVGFDYMMEELEGCSDAVVQKYYTQLTAIAAQYEACIANSI